MTAKDKGYSSEQNIITIKVEVGIQKKEVKENIPLDKIKVNTNIDMVGIVNQGNTCHLNSVLQALYHNTDFRKTILQLQLSNDASVTSLQSTFYNLQMKNKVETHKLTEALKIENVQLDAYDTKRDLMNVLEEKMKGTKSESAIKQLFVGKTRSFIKGVYHNYIDNVPPEEFYDIELDVLG